MAFDLNNFVIDRVVRGIAVSQGDNTKLGISAGDVLFSINQITNPSLSCTSESTDAVDALSVPIATFYRSKAAEFSAENALFDMNLIATQSGTTKKVAGNKGAKIEAPCFQTIDVEAGKVEYGLTHTPMENTTPKVYVLNGDGTLGDKINVVTDPYNKEVSIAGKKLEIGTSAKEFVAKTVYAVGDYVTYKAAGADAAKTYICTIAVDGTSESFVAANWKEVTDKSNLFAEGSQIFIMYDYMADGTEGNGAVEVANSATNFPVGCKFIMEILGADVCDQTNLIYAYLIFPNAKLSPDFDWSKI